MSRSRWPQRIVTLTAENTEIVYRLGAGDRVVGVCGFSTRPPEARQKPRVGGYTTPNLEKVAQLDPDLVLAFSDLQAEAVAQLLRRGIPVLCTYQKSLGELFQSILVVGGAIGCQVEAERLVTKLEASVETVRRRAADLPRRPRVFFEEWPDPIISGIRWVSELIAVAGGEDIFADLHAPGSTGSSRERIVSAEEVARRRPEVYIGSWCGRRVNVSTVYSRPEWRDLPALITGQTHEIKSAEILQPGPAIVEGLGLIAEIVAAAAEGRIHQPTAGRPR